jgi:hypothetical protein
MGLVAMRSVPPVSDRRPHASGNARAAIGEDELFLLFVAAVAVLLLGLLIAFLLLACLLALPIVVLPAWRLLALLLVVAHPDVSCCGDELVADPR